MARCLIIAFALGVILPGVSRAELSLDAAGWLAVYGDARLRLEKDWDSWRGDGTQRDDRSRLRIRARLGLKLRPVEWVEVGARARTGNDDHQQSGHITIADFNGNANGASDLNLDKWYVKFQRGDLSVWGGRNSLPWWKQNSLFWDDDVTPRGGGLTYSSPIGEGRFTLNAGLYTLPAGMRDYTGDAASGQMVWEQDGERLGFTLAAGIMAIDADRNPDEYAANLLLQDNAFRDYQVWVTQGQLRFNALPEPFYVGFDFIHNAEGYAADDPSAFTAFHRDDTDGWVLQAVYGGVRERGDWLAGLYYARIEALALHNSYAQDDWLRWGSSDQTASSNFKGPEFRLGAGLGHNINVVARLFLVRGIERDLPSDVRNQTGKRARIDLNWSF